MESHQPISDIEAWVSQSYEDTKTPPGFFFQDAVHGLTKEKANGLFQNLRVRLRQAEKKKDPIAVAWTYLRMAMVFRGRRDYVSAISILHRAQNGFQSADDQNGLAVLFEELACVNRELNRNALALDYSQKAIERYQMLDRPLELGWVYDNMAVIYLNMARRQESMTYAKKARSIFLEHKNPGCLAWNACNLGNLHYEMGLYADATAYYQEALNTFQSLGVKQGVAWSTLWLGMLARAQTDFSAAEKYLIQAKKDFMDLELRDRAGWAVMNLAGIRWAQGQYKEAALLNQNAIQLFKPLHNNDGVAWGTFQQAQVLRDQGRLTQAWQLLRQALNLYSHIASQKGTGWAECELGEIYLLLADQPHAKDCFLRARSFADRLSLVPLKAEVEKNLSNTFLDGGLVDEALRSFETAETLCVKTHSVEILAEVLLVKARIAIVKADFASAYDFIHQAEKVIEAHGLGRLNSTLLIFKGECFLSGGKIEEAVSCFSDAMFQAKKMDQRISYIQAALGHLQASRAKKSSRTAMKQLKELEKLVRACGSRRLKAKLLVMEAILHQDNEEFLDMRHLRQSLDILDQSDLVLMKKQFLELFAYLSEKKDKEEAQEFGRELQSFLGQRGKDFADLPNRRTLFETFPISVVS